MNHVHQILIGACLLAGSAFGNLYYVSPTGSDAYACSYAQPCRSFQGAYSKTLAGDTIIALGRASYGSLSVQRSITVDGGIEGALIEGGGISISTPNPSDITFRNITILPEGSFSQLGIDAVLNDARLTLENVSILGPHGGSSIAMQIDAAPTARLIFRKLRVDIGGQGIFITHGPPTMTAPYSLLIEDASISASFGLVAFDGNVTIRDSVFFGTGVSLGASSVTPNSTAERTTFVGASTALSISAGSIRLKDCLFSGNSTAVAASGTGSVVSFRNNAFAGNTTDGATMLATSLK